MKQIMTVAMALALSSPIAHAQVYRCTNEDGGAVYQDQPCSGESQTLDEGNLSTTPSQPAQRNRERTQADVEASRQRQQRIDEAEERVQRIRNENADPEKCAQARRELNVLKARGADMRGTSAIETRTRIMLYCEQI